MTEEQINISNQNSKGTLDIKDHDGLELLIDKEPLLVSWDGDGQYSWRYAFLRNINISKLHSFRIFEETISIKSLSQSKEEISFLLSLFVRGNFSIKKYKSQDKEAGKYIRLADYSIEIPNQRIDNYKEKDIQKNFESYFVEQYKKNNSTHTIIDWTTDGFPTLQDPVIALKTKSEIDEGKIDAFKKEIANGKEPHCLIFSISAEGEDSMNCYCIGTIEILIAYYQLNINPRFIEIKKIKDENSKLEVGLIKELGNRLFSWQLNSIFDRYSNDEEEIVSIINHSEHPFKPFIRNGQTVEFWPNKTIKSEGFYLNNKPNGIVTNYYPDGKTESIWFYNEVGERIRPIKQYFPTGELRTEFVYNEGDSYGINKLYRINGTLQREMYFLEGVNYIMLNGRYYIMDGKSEIIYHENGREEYVGIYKDGKKVDWKKYDTKGNLVSQMNNSA